MKKYLIVSHAHEVVNYATDHRTHIGERMLFFRVKRGVKMRLRTIYSASRGDWEVYTYYDVDAARKMCESFNQTHGENTRVMKVESYIIHLGGIILNLKKKPRTPKVDTRIKKLEKVVNQIKKLC